MTMPMDSTASSTARQRGQIAEPGSWPMVFAPMGCAYSAVEIKTKTLMAKNTAAAPMFHFFIVIILAVESRNQVSSG